MSAMREPFFFALNLALPAKDARAPSRLTLHPARSSLRLIVQQQALSPK